MAKLLEPYIPVSNSDGQMERVDWYCYRGEWVQEIDPITGLLEWVFKRDSISYSGTLYQDDLPSNRPELKEIVKDMLIEDKNLQESDFKGAHP